MYVDSMAVAGLYALNIVGIVLMTLILRRVTRPAGRHHSVRGHDGAAGRGNMANGSGAGGALPRQALYSIPLARPDRIVARG